MKYVILEKQYGEGCDYTIGCGMRYSFEDFDGNIEEALKHFGHLAAYPEGEDAYFALDDNYEFNLSELWVIPFAGGQVDLDMLKAVHEAQEKEERRTAKESRERIERSEYERLKEKFG